MTPAVTPSHRGGSGETMVLLHGFTDTWRTWELVLPILERRYDVFAPTLPGHAGGPPLPAGFDPAVITDGLEQILDDAGIDTAHIVGNSLGGFAAFRLAERGRARSVVALAPAGGWAEGDSAAEEPLDFFRGAQKLIEAAAPHADAIVASSAGRRRATEFMTVNYEHIPAELLAHQLRGVADCSAAAAFIEHALTYDWAIDAGRISCPVRVIWGTADRILRWPRAAARFHEALGDADWVVLENVGHLPQLDVPERTAQAILEFVGGG